MRGDVMMVLWQCGQKLYCHSNANTPVYVYTPFKSDVAFLLTIGSLLLAMVLFYLQSCLGFFLLATGAFLHTIGAFVLTMGKCF